MTLQHVKATVSNLCVNESKYKLKTTHKMMSHKMTFIRLNDNREDINTLSKLQVTFRYCKSAIVDSHFNLASRKILPNRNDIINFHFIHKMYNPKSCTGLHKYGMRTLKIIYLRPEYEQVINL